MTTRDENHEYALAIIEAKNGEIRDLLAAIHKLTSALIEAGVERSTLRTQLAAARLVTDAGSALYRASAVDRVSVDDVQEKLVALFAALSEAP